jgi:hypothetical protein
MTVLDLLLEYVRRDWYVFPLKPGTKVPATKNGWKDASLDLEQITDWLTRWPNCGWGIATGPSNLLVVDLDGPAGERAWLELTQGSKRPTPSTIVSMTGSGGWHLVFADPGGSDSRRGRNSTRMLGPGIDTRGVGGYIVAPPSMHPNGKRYQWFGEELRQPAVVPPWILRRLRTDDAGPAQPQTLRMAISGGDDTPLGSKVLAGILARLADAQDGQRHDLNYWAGVRAGQLHAAGHVGAHALGAVLDQALAKRKDHAATRRDTLDGWRWGIANTGSYAPATVDMAVPRIEAPRAYVPRIPIQEAS